MIKPLRFMLTLMLVLTMSIVVEAKTPAELAAEQEGLVAFRNFLDIPKSKADCLSRMQILFHSAYIHGELNARGLDRPKQNLAVDKGALDVDIVAGGELININLPFYFVENERGTEFYFALDDDWKKLSFDDINLNTLDGLDTDSILAFVDRAVLVNDAGGQQILHVSFSGEKLAQTLEDMNEPYALGIREALLNTGALNVDFSLNKETGQPLMIAFDMSSLLQNSLRAFAAQQSGFQPTAADLIDGLSKSSRLEFYVICDYSGKYDAKEFKLPRAVRKAKDITKDVQSSAKTGSTGTP